MEKKKRGNIHLQKTDKISQDPFRLALLRACVNACVRECRFFQQAAVTGFEGVDMERKNADLGADGIRAHPRRAIS
jgi:hypothetical protein